MRDYYSTLTPQLIQDNKMHVLYPVNLFYNTAGSDNNSIHNSDADSKTMEAACGTVWISTNPDDADADYTKAGYIHGTPDIDIQFRHKEFYPCLGKYEGLDESGLKDISNFTAYSYAKMLDINGYSSPHFRSSLLAGRGTPLVAATSYSGKRIYSIDSDTIIYDHLFSSYYVKPEGNRLNVYYLVSKMRADYGTENESESTPAKQVALRNNVDTMLKYIVNATEIDDDEHVYNGLRLYDDYDDDSNMGYMPVRTIGIMPVYLSNIDNTDMNVYTQRLQLNVWQRATSSYLISHNSNVPQSYVHLDHWRFLNRQIWTYYFSDEDMRARNPAWTYGTYTEMRRRPLNMITIGKISQTYINHNFVDDEQKLKGTTYLGLCDESISCAFLNNSAYIKIFSNDPKWKSVPFNDKTKFTNGHGSQTAISSIATKLPLVHDEDYYCDEYLAPYTIDHYIREQNLIEARKFEKGSVSSRKQKVLFSNKPIKCYTSQSSNVTRLYNSANLINSIKWGTDENGKHIMVFENSADMLRDDIS